MENRTQNEMSYEKSELKKILIVRKCMQLFLYLFLRVSSITPK